MQIDSPSILAESFEGNVDQYGMLPIYETFRTLLYASASCCSNTYNLEHLNIEQPDLTSIYVVMIAYSVRNQRVLLSTTLGA